VIIENMNLIVKLGNLSVCRIDFLGVIEGVILVDRFSSERFGGCYLIKR